MSKTQSSPYKVGLCSAPMRDNEIEHQIAVMQHFLEEAPGCELLCFGESFLQGFEGLSWDYAIDCQRAIPSEGHRMDTIRKMAQEFACGLSFGFIEIFEDQLYSSNIVLDAQGQTLDLFRRVSIGWKEHSITGPQYREGPGFHCFDLAGQRAAAAICGDLWYEENIIALKALGPEVLLWPLYIDYSISDWEAGEKQEYARQVQTLNCPVLMINSLADDPERANGGACVFYGGEILAELPMGQTGILCFDLHTLTREPLSCTFEHYLIDFSHLS